MRAHAESVNLEFENPLDEVILQYCYISFINDKNIYCLLMTSFGRVIKDIHIVNLHHCGKRRSQNKLVDDFMDIIVIDIILY